MDAGQQGKATDSKRRGIGAPRGRRGSSAAEFAFIMPAFLVLLVGVTEVCWQLTIAASLDRATIRASRFGITGQATQSGTPEGITCRSQTIPWIVQHYTGRLLNVSRLNVTTGAHNSASAMSGAATPGAGGASQVVTYSITYTEPFLTGVWINMLGGPPEIVHRATVVVKNEAFDNATC
jgi:Flp pilus assembly protein TadG